MARRDKKLTTAFDEQEEVVEEIVEEVVVEVETTGEKTLSEDLMSDYIEKSKKPTIDDTHTRRTFLVEKELIKKLDRVAKGKRGFKTMAINKALKAILQDFK
ncbi:hypothetical protein LKL95_27680 [Bacillus cereus]|uniref:hypothetical protein n=1 Tax=Bacillus cereus group TaxID=86661 RepID=UPI0002795DEB|nr:MULTISPECIES: hypothetical protein [Bacillus cereus group]EJQ77737.1 hypothetical protein IGO_05715 [Bacillus toyonensis]MCC2397560.1 hypothetical protein [Bacillus cereus]